MHDIAEFLRRHAPFDDVADEAIEELARSAEVEFFAAGATIFRQRDEPRKHVWIVRRGAVELVDQGRVLDLLGEGELFGHPSMLSGLPTGFEARAAEDSLCYRLPAEAVVPLLARPAGLRYVARSLIARPWSDATGRAMTLRSSPWHGSSMASRSSSRPPRQSARPPGEWPRRAPAPRWSASRTAGWGS